MVTGMRRSTEPHIPDPYADLSVHGTLPLAADPTDPCGVRFARLGRDAPDDCLADPAALPEAELTIHAFVGSEARDLYVEALREHAGNAVRWTVSEPRAPALALVARFDRPRSVGATLRDAVRLVAHGTRLNRLSLAEEMVEGRRHVLRMVARDRAEGKARERWADVVEALRGIPGVSDVGARGMGDVLTFTVAVHGDIAGRDLAVWLTDAGLALGGTTWHGGYLRRTPSAVADLARSDAAADLVGGPSGMVGMPLAGPIDEAAVRRVLATLDAREEAVVHLREAQGSR